MYKITFRAMGSWIEALVIPESPEAQSLLEKVPNWFEEWEQILSRFRPDSELSRLNRLAGQPVQVSKTLWDVLQISLQAEEESSGLVTPTILKALEYAGYERSFELLSTSTAGRHSFPAVQGVESILFDASSRTVIIPEGVRLDFGGSAKGWAADKAMRRLSKIGPALVNAGGDISVFSKDGQQSWDIGVLDPFHPDENITTITLPSGGVATSGTDYRKWLQGDQVRHHIIDPRTGLPADSDIISATIVAGNVMEAEMAAKTTLLLGSIEGLNWLVDRPQLAGILVCQDGSIHKTENIQRFIKE